MKCKQCAREFNDDVVEDLRYREHCISCVCKNILENDWEDI